jgi:uncharacterized membrane protein YphA (DoxX/SURF4 family)
MKALKFFFQIILGAIYLISGISKAADINGFADILMQYGNSYLYLLAPIIACIEIIFAFLLFLSWNTRKVALFSFFFISVLTIVFVLGLFFSGVDDCGCLGSFYKLPVWFSFTRNILMILMSYRLFVQDRNYDQSRIELLKLFVSLAFGLATLLLSSQELLLRYKLATYHPGKNINKTFIGQFLKNSEEESLIFLFSPNCEHCIAITPKIIDKAKGGEYNRIIGLYPKELPDSLISNYNNRFKPNFPLYPVPYDSIIKFTKSVPFFVSVRYGIIKEVGFEI